MRVYVKATIPVEAGNAVIKSGKLAPTLQAIIQDLKPETVFFFTDQQGRRTTNLLMDLKDASQIPAIAEPFFLAFNASVEIHPVMLAEDLEKAGPAIGQAVERYGGTL
jgi:hypothetical protein